MEMVLGALIMGIGVVIGGSLNLAHLRREEETEFRVEVDGVKGPEWIR